MEKAARIDSVRNSLTREELLRRLPEIDAIYAPETREATIRYFLDYCPEYFWEAAASASGNYHPTDERGKHGLWLHSKRVFYEYANLSESLVELHEITEEEREAGKSAALIHDTFQRGWPSENTSNTSQEHDIIAASVAAQVENMPQETVDLVKSHMGAWAEGPAPESKNELCFHFADKSAAADNHTQAVYFPSDEILDEWPAVEQVEVEDGEAV